MALADLVMHLTGGVSAEPAQVKSADVAPLVLEIYVPPPKPRRFKLTFGSFVVLVFGETRAGKRARFRFEPMTHDESRRVWRTLSGQGLETEWVRAERVPACPPGVVDAADLAELWRAYAVMPREQLEMW